MNTGEFCCEDIMIYLCRKAMMKLMSIAECLGSAFEVFTHSSSSADADPESAKMFHRFRTLGGYSCVWN